MSVCAAFVATTVMLYPVPSRVFAVIIAAPVAGAVTVNFTFDLPINLRAVTIPSFVTLATSGSSDDHVKSREDIVSGSMGLRSLLSPIVRVMETRSDCDCCFFSQPEIIRTTDRIRMNFLIYMPL
jgi:hypothetical protein